MKRIQLVLLASAAALVAGLAAGAAQADDRYQPRAAVGVSPDLSAPWLLQLQRNPVGGSAAPVQRGGGISSQDMVARYRAKAQRINEPEPLPVIQPVAAPMTVQQVPAWAKPKAAPRSAAQADANGKSVNSQFLPQIVAFDTNDAPGSIIIDTNSRFLYLVLGNGTARRYGVGVGKPGFEWAGTHKITRKAEWPTWTPPAEMIERVRQKEGRILPNQMAGGPENPLGARAMYLGSTLYRIHGTNQPWSIGKAVSSGCIRMRNEDVIDLYERVRVGTKVTVL